jgi:hypothetical protein
LSGIAWCLFFALVPLYPPDVKPNQVNNQKLMRFALRKKQQRSQNQGLNMFMVWLKVLHSFKLAGKTVQILLSLF